MKQTLLILACSLSSAVALAEGGAAAAPDWKQSFGPMLPLFLMFGIFYFLVLRPQQKKSKLHQRFLTELKRGDMVVTNSGMIGMVKNLSDKLITLEVDSNVCIKMLRTQISESAHSLKESGKTKS